MTVNPILKSSLDFNPEKQENIMESIFEHYEKVIVESLVTSFGLDFLIEDRLGGDVDTINNVRKEEVGYKNEDNELNYNNRGNYNSATYHSHKNYKEVNKGVKEAKKSGQLIDAYTGKKIPINGKSDLDHVISAKEIHDDPARVLAGLNGSDLANSRENLKATNLRTNRTKKADSMTKFHENYQKEYSQKELKTMRDEDSISRKSYESKLSKKYYTSPNFRKDLGIAAANVGIKTGLKQALGLVFSEIWFEVKNEFNQLTGDFDFTKFLNSISAGITKGFKNATKKYKELLEKFKDGALIGILSSLTTTLCNIFFTTSKNIIKVIRQSYVSLVQAFKVLFINPDNLEFGEMMRAVVKLLSTGASVVLGTLVSELIGKTAIAGIPIVGEIIQTFCGTLVTGIMSCSLLYFFDRHESINKLVKLLNNIPNSTSEVNYYKNQVSYLEEYAAKLMEIDINKFKEETEIYNSFTLMIENSHTEIELNKILVNMCEKLGIKKAWEGNLDTFMKDEKSKLVFS